MCKNTFYFNKIKWGFKKLVLKKNYLKKKIKKMETLHFIIFKQKRVKC